ncbi:MAG: 1-aminocyclopropane-1-carboxylate deaminase/D-cysteine desulfhydrase [Planctomycetota bacterium]
MKPLPLALVPTPLEPYPRLGDPVGIDLHVKRDDLTGAALSGNKVRKLGYLLAEAEAQGADMVLTCGAVTSNHARATAVAAASRGLACRLLLRGREPARVNGNLLIDRLVGADVTFIGRSAWRRRNELLAEMAEDVRAAGGRPYVIPEGGSNAVGSLGYVDAARELLDQAEAMGLDVRHVVHATGSGGTTAGLAWGFARLGRSDIDVAGIAVCDDADYFDRVVRRILDEAAQRGLATAAEVANARWRIVDTWKGIGYAKTTPEEIAAHREVASLTGLIVDPVYTGKALRGLLGEAREGRLGREGATVFLHTGGLFGWFQMPEVVAG